MYSAWIVNKVYEIYNFYCSTIELHFSMNGMFKIMIKTFLWVIMIQGKLK